MITVTAETIQPVDYPDGTTTWQDGCLLDRYKKTVSFYWQKGTQQGNSYALNNGVITITGLGNNPSNENFLTDKFQPGEVVKLPGSVANAGRAFTITAVTATTLAVTGTMTNEQIVNSYIWVTNNVTGFDYFYNLIQNGQQANFNSLTDQSVQQKYRISGISAASGATALLIGTKSFAWVTDTITGTNTSQATITGMGVTGDFKQQFEIVHYYYIAPFSLASQLRNFQQKTEPGYFPLQYIYSLNAYYDATTPNVIDNFVSTETNGTSCWLNDNSIDTQTDFTVSSVKYVDDATGNPLTAIDFSKTVDVTMALKSGSGSFINPLDGESNFIVLNHIYLPLSPVDYQNTPTTLRENSMHDRKAINIGAASANGDNYGGNYSVIKNIVSSYVDAYNMTITFQVAYAAFLQGILKTKAIGNRNYAIILTIEGANASTRVAVLCDCQNMQYDQRNAALCNPWDFIHCFAPPNLLGGETKDIAGREGDSRFIQFPFQVQTTPINGITPKINNVSVSILAMKTGESDFVLESKTWNCSFECFKKGVQQLNFNDTRGYNSYQNDPYNSIILQNNKTYSRGSKAGYMLQYGFVLRYDYWNNIVSSQPGGTNCGTDISGDGIETVNSWSGLSENGWSLVLRTYVEMIGYDGAITGTQWQTPMRVVSAATPPDSLLNYAQTSICYNDNAPNGTIVIPSPLPDAVTRIRTIFMPNGFTDVIPNGYLGMMWADIVGGNPQNRRNATTENASEDNSPFSDPGTIAVGTDGMRWADPDETGVAAPNQYCNGGVRIAYYTTGPLNGVVIIETNYDDAVTGWSNHANSLIMYAKIDFKTDGIDTEDGQPIEAETGDILIQE